MSATCVMGFGGSFDEAVMVVYTGCIKLFDEVREMIGWYLCRGGCVQFRCHVLMQCLHRSIHWL